MADINPLPPAQDPLVPIIGEIGLALNDGQVTLGQVADAFRRAVTIVIAESAGAPAAPRAIQLGPAITPDQFAERMQEAADAGDTEISRSDMDELMCALLTSLGYGKGVEIFKAAAKWYA